jgi:hypothetical protein
VWSRTPAGWPPNKMSRTDRRLPAIAIGCWLALALPIAREWLEATMLRHMLVQFPLLAGIGWIIGRSLRVDRWRSIATYNRFGATGLLLAVFVMTLWMLPRMLDAATGDSAFALGKFVSLPAAGFALAASWPACPRIARAVVHVEVLATLLRFGWGYLEAPQRLCLNYLLDDQSRVGAWLLVASAAYALIVVWPVMFGALPRFARLPRS